MGPISMSNVPYGPSVDEIVAIVYRKMRWTPVPVCFARFILVALDRAYAPFRESVQWVAREAPTLTSVF